MMVLGDLAQSGRLVSMSTPLPRQDDADAERRTPTPITQFGDPVLRLQCSEIDPADIPSQEIQDLIDEMVVSLEAAGGIGLAAPQISVPKRLFIVRIPASNRVGYGPTPETPLTVVINP